MLMGKSNQWYTEQLPVVWNKSLEVAYCFQDLKHQTCNKSLGSMSCLEQWLLLRQRHPTSSSALPLTKANRKVMDDFR